MHPSQNAFVYPSVNAGFVLSDAIKLPDFINYAKIRASWGAVGNYPPMYLANIAYSLANLGDQGNGSINSSTIRTSPFGNDFIKPELKRELELGLEMKFLKNRLGLDISYYDANVKDQILNLTLPQSSGASSILANVGNLKNTGLEIALNGAPVVSKNFTWDAGINFAFNKNKLVKLTTGQNELTHWNADGDALKLVSTVGQSMGDYYAHLIATDTKGQQMVNDDGTWAIDGSKWSKIGNRLPKVVGGVYNTFKYKGFSLDILADYRFGGYENISALNWMTSRGLTKESLNGMDKAHGGVSYYLGANNKGVQTSSATGPNGETVYNDGILLDGVTSSGAKNTNVIPQSVYYWYSYNWGGPQYYGSNSSLYFKYVQKNSYIKLRELSLAYSFSPRIASKLLAKKLTLSVFGRNLFYLYRTIKDMDAEQASTGQDGNGSSWLAGGLGTNPSSRSFGVMLRANF
jgi:hypothetical protein